MTNNEQGWEEVKKSSYLYWKPDETTTSIEGVYVNDYENPDEEPRPIIDSKVGLAVLPGHQVLTGFFKDIDYGTLVKVVWEGEVKSDKGRTYNDYKVYRWNNG